MERRDFVKTGLAAGTLALSPHAAAEAEAQTDDRHFYELRVYETRSDMSPARLRAFYKDHFIPALQRAGAGLVGVFAPEIGLNGQTLIVLVDYAKYADVLSVRDRLDTDRAYRDALRAFEADPQPPYERYESRLLRAFPNHRRVERPTGDATRPSSSSRVFELRTYESRSTATLATKIDMFDQAEIDLFRRIGMAPVFFGESIFGPRMPSLTYMLAFDDLAARASAWAGFRVNPEWQKLSTDPKWTVDGLTTTTGAVLLNPQPFSQIR
jgi:hypothetical protein